MTNEEMQKAIEFIINQQVQFSIRTQKSESRLVKLEDASVMLVEMAQITDERLDRIEERLGRIEQTMNSLGQAANSLDQMMIEMVSAQIRTDTKPAELAEAQAHTERRRSSASMKAGIKTTFRICYLTVDPSV